MKHVVSLTFLLTVAWLGWSGHFETLTLALGAASIAFVVVLSRRMQLVDHEGAPLGLHFGRIALYLVWLSGEIIKANLDVARRILTPGRPPIAPRIFSVKVQQRSDLAQVVFANSITLTPGTIAIDVADGEVLVHALHEDAARGVEEGTMNRRCAELEGARG